MTSSQVYSDDLGVSHLERVEAVMSNPALYALTDGLFPRDPTRGGRPQVYPDYLVVVVGCLADIFDGSARAASTALAGPLVWARIREIAVQQCPGDRSKWLPKKPPHRSWYVKRKNRIDARVLEELRTRLTRSAVATAEELGLLDPNGPGTPAHPESTRMIYHDGKAIRQMYNGAPGDTREVDIVDWETGEVRVEVRPVRADPDAKVHITGDKRQIHGSKFWHAEVRGDTRFSRVILAVDHVPGVKDEKNSEADIAVKNLLALAPHVPGALGAMCDTVLRGIHIHPLERGTGWIIMNPVTAASVDIKTRERTEKEQFLRTVYFLYANGSSEEVDVWISGGRLCRVEYAYDGTKVLVPLKRVGNPVRKNRDGTFRTYVEYEVPCPRGEKPTVIREATYQQDTDGTFNRAENIRQIPPGDPDYERLIGRRSDAEAANRQIDDHLYLRRARSLGARRQLFDLICHAFAENSVARHRHRMTAGPDPAIAA